MYVTGIEIFFLRSPKIVADKHSCHTLFAHCSG